MYTKMATKDESEKPKQQQVKPAVQQDDEPDEW